MSKSDTMVLDLANCDSFDPNMVTGVNKLIVLDLTEEFIRFSSVVIAKTIITDVSGEVREFLFTEKMDLFKVVMEEYSLAYRLYPEAVAAEEFVQAVIGRLDTARVLDCDWEQEHELVFTLLSEDFSIVDSIAKFVDNLIKTHGYSMSKLLPFRWTDIWVKYELKKLQYICAACDLEKDNDYIWDKPF